MGLIAASRYKTLKSHLKHWVAFIDKNTKVKDLERNDCEVYYEWRHAQAEGDVQQKTVHGEQATINRVMKWLCRQNETSIDGFDFKKLKRIDDAGDYTNAADVPYYYIPCMCAGLAYYLSLKYAPDRTQNLKLLYEDELLRAEAADGSSNSTFVTPKTYYPSV